MGHIHVISRQSMKPEFYLGLFNGVTVTQSDLVPFSKGDIISFSFCISREDYNAIGENNTDGVDFWSFPDIDDEDSEEEKQYWVVLKFTVIEKEHSLLARHSDNMLLVESSSTSMTLAPVTDDVEQALRRIYNSILFHGGESEIPF